jgi:hypothetical protein
MKRLIANSKIVYQLEEDYDGRRRAEADTHADPFFCAEKGLNLINHKNKVTNIPTTRPTALLIFIVLLPKHDASIM